MRIRWKSEPVKRIEGLTVKEISEILGTSVQNVYQALKRHGADRVIEVVKEKQKESEMKK